MKLFLKKTISVDMACHISISLIYLMMIALVVIPIGSAASGEVIVFYRENNQIVGDVGHVGVAIQLEDGTWFAGAVEGPGGLWGITGTLGGNGGWSSPFNTKEDVIKEFASSSSHAAYTSMKSIQVQEINGKDAKSVMENFKNYGFAIYANNDCYTRVYDAMEAYGVDANSLIDDGFHIGDKDWLRPPKDFFNDLPGESDSLSYYTPPLSSFLNTGPLDPFEEANHMYDAAASYEQPTRIVNEQNSGSSKPENWDASAGGFNEGQFPRVYV